MATKLMPSPRLDTAVAHHWRQYRLGRGLGALVGLTGPRGGRPFPGPRRASCSLADRIPRAPHDIGSANVVRTILPSVVRGTSSTSTSARGAWKRGHRRLDVVAQLVERGRIVAGDHVRHDHLAPLGVGRPATATSATAGCVGQHRLDRLCGHTFSPPVMIRSPIRPSTTSRPSASRWPASPVANQPSTSGDGAVAIAAEQHRAPQVHLAVDDAELDTVERDRRS